MSENPSSRPGRIRPGRVRPGAGEVSDDGLISAHLTASPSITATLVLNIRLKANVRATPSITAALGAPEQLLEAHLTASPSASAALEREVPLSADLVATPHIDVEIFTGSGPDDVQLSANLTASPSITADLGPLEVPLAAALTAEVSLLASLDRWASGEGPEPWIDRPPHWEALAAVPGRVARPTVFLIDYADLDSDGRALYMAALRRSKPAKVAVDVLGPDEEPVGSLTAPASVVYGGSVAVDTSAPIPMRLSLSLADPDRALLELDALVTHGAPISPAAGLAVRRLDFVPALQQWVACPVFQGIVTAYTRSGPDVSLEALSKEHLYLEDERIWRTVTVARGVRVVDAIRRIAQAQGETRFHLPDVDRRLIHPLSVPHGAEAWPVISRLARTVGRTARFNTTGQLELRQLPMEPAWTFTAGGDEATVIGAEPELAYDATVIRNAVHVLGRAPSKGARPQFVAVAPPAHPLSPQSLARNGIPRYKVERIESDQIVTTAAAETLARQRLSEFLIAGLSASFEALAIPPVMPDDVARLEGAGVDVTFRLTSYTLPLTGTGAMQVGEAKRIPITGARSRVMRGRVTV